MLRSVATAALALLLVGCQPKRSGERPAPPLPRITVSRALAYELGADSLRQAYRKALEQRGLTVREEEGSLHAQTPPREMPGIVRVDFRPSETLATRVAIVFTYRVVGLDFHHYPYHLPIEAHRHLDRATRRVELHQGRFPESALSCPEATPLESSAGVEEPRLVPGPHIVQRRAQYTDEARVAGTQGVVYLSAVVAEDGSVQCVDVLSGLPHGLSAAAARALLGARFAPALLNGRAIARRVILPVKFLLSG